MRYYDLYNAVAWTLRAAIALCLLAGISHENARHLCFVAILLFVILVAWEAEYAQDRKQRRR